VRPRRTEQERRIERQVVELYRKQPFPNYRQKLNPRYLDRFERLYRRVGLPIDDFPRLRVLDGGCGTGEESLALAHFGCRRVVGIDVTDASLEVARRSAKERGARNVNFVRGSLLDIPFAAESFDMVVSHGVIHHTGNPQLALANLVRVLKPGGYLSLFVYNKFGHVFNNWERALVHRLAGSDLDRQVSVAKRLFWWRAHQDAYGPDLDAKLYDQYAHPHKTDHAIGEVMSWFRQNGLSYKGAYPPITARALIDELAKHDENGNFAIHWPVLRPACYAARAMQRGAKWSASSGAVATSPSLVSRFMAQAGVLVLGMRDYSIGFTFCGRKM
jgi:SAM-dependent methyltransferase